MGSRQNEGSPDEQPQHFVTIKSFMLGQFLILEKIGQEAIRLHEILALGLEIDTHQGQGVAVAGEACCDEKTVAPAVAVKK